MAIDKRNAAPWVKVTIWVISGLLVIARNSAFVYKGRAVDVKAVGRQLGVRYVVEGSVRRAANRLRITAQLIDAQSGMHLWAERYDRALNDVFALQDEVTRTIVDALSIQILAEEHQLYPAMVAKFVQDTWTTKETVHAG